MNTQSSSHTMEEDEILKLDNMSYDEFNKCPKAKEEERKRKREPGPETPECTPDELQRRQRYQRFRKREDMRKRTMSKYSKSEDLSRLEEDVNSYNNLYMFNFLYAKVQSPKFRELIECLNNDNFGKVYLAFNSSLAKRIDTCLDGTTGSSGRKLGSRFTKSKSLPLHEGELRPGLHEIASMLVPNDVGILLTDKTEEDVLSKFQQYTELDYAQPYDIPKSSLVYEKDKVLQLPSARKLFPTLQELGMPVELIGRVLKLTEDFTVCEKGVYLTENAATILKLLKIKMFPYFVRPVCRWSASTMKTHHYPPREMVNDDIWASCLGGDISPYFDL